MKREASKGNMNDRIKKCERIRELQKERGWSDSELARRVGVNKSTIARWYEVDMMPATFHKVCEAFELSEEQFYCEGKEVLVDVRIQRRLQRMNEDEKELYDRIGDLIADWSEEHKS